MSRILTIALGVACALAPLEAEGPAEVAARTVSTQRIDFAPGSICWIGFRGDLYIEGWNQPRVEITVVKSTNYYEAAEVKTQAARLSNTDLIITTTLPAHTKNKVTLEYRVYVPRDVRLVIDHRGGMVTAGNTTGDIEVSNRDGDIMLLLPAQGAYSIDARIRMGHIASDFEGKTRSRYVVGQSFAATGPAPTRRIHLRNGFGGITILSLPAEGEALSTGGGEVPLE